MNLVVLVALAAVLGLGMIVFGLLSTRRSSALIDERLGLIEKKETKPEGKERKAPVADALNRALARRGVGANLATKLARANLKITVGEFLVANALLVVFFGLVAFALRRDVIVTLIACAVGFFAPHIYVSMRRGQRLRAFNDQLGDTINLMVNGIRAGYSILQAMEAVSKEMGPPVSEEFGRVVKEVQLGLTLDQALANMLRRVTSDDLDMMVTAINVQREVGGNLAEVLDSISYTIRERVRIKGDIRALTAYGRGAGTLLSVIPVILAVIVYLITPDFMSQLFTDWCGRTMLGIAIIGIVAGYFVIKKIVNIEV